MGIPTYCVPIELAHSTLSHVRIGCDLLRSVRPEAVGATFALTLGNPLSVKSSGWLTHITWSDCFPEIELSTNLTADWTIGIVEPTVWSA
jgi:hypothetical protein